MRLFRLHNMLIALTVFVTPGTLAAQDHSKNVSFNEVLHSYIQHRSSRGTKLEVSDFLPPSDSRYQKARSVTEAVKAAYLELYPNVAHRIGSPYILILKDQNGDKHEHHAVQAGELDIIGLGSGIFDSQSESQLHGVVAHELGHFLFFKAQHSPQELIVWRQTSDKFVWPNQIEHDAQLAFHLNDWRKDARVAGGFSQPELNGLPLDESIIASMFFTFVADLFEGGPPSYSQCLSKKGFSDLSKAFQHIYQTSFSYLHFDIYFDSDEQRSSVASLASKLTEALSACYEPGVVTWDQLLEQSSISNQPLSNIRALFEAYASITDFNNIPQTLIEATEGVHKRMNSTYSLHRLEEVRFLSDEDVIDQISISILKKLNLNYQEFARFAVDSLLADKPKELQSCETLIESQTEPPFGYLADSHHAPCWRYFHLKKFGDTFDKVEWLEQMLDRNI